MVSLQPNYDCLTERGQAVRGAYTEIADRPLQFLPAPDALAEEAICEARTTDVDGESARVYFAKHFVPVALETGLETKFLGDLL